MITSLTATLQTGPGRRAGTDDRVWLDVGGATFELHRAGANLFEPGAADAFVLPLPAPGLPRNDVWRVLVCKNPDRDPEGWDLAALTLVDQAGAVLYSGSGLAARLDASTGRTWQAPDFRGPTPPPFFRLTADALRVLLEGPIHESVQGDVGSLKQVRASGPLGLAIECDGITVSQRLRGRIEDTAIDIVISAGIRPFVSGGSGPAPAQLEVAIRGLHVDLQIPAWLHVVTLGASAIAEHALEQHLSGKLRGVLREQMAGKLTGLGLDLSRVDRLALFPGVLEVIMDRPPLPRLNRPFPWRWA